MYRIWNHKNKCWVRNEVYVSPHMDIVQTEPYKKRRDVVKIRLLPDNRFTIHSSIGANDKNGTLLFEGDIVKSSTNLIGIITYVPEKLAYVVLDFKELKYYPLNTERCSSVEIIGNVCENPDIVPEYGEQQTLSE